METSIPRDQIPNPPRVEYSLTGKGVALYDILLAVALWNAHYVREKNPLEKEQPGMILSI